MSGRSASTGASPPLMPASSSSTSTHQLLIDRTLEPGETFFEAIWAEPAGWPAGWFSAVVKLDRLLGDGQVWFGADRDDQDQYEIGSPAEHRLFLPPPAP